MTVDEFHECDATLRARPARDRGAGPRAASPTWTGCSSTPGPTAPTCCPRPYRGGRARLGRRLVPQPRRARTRTPTRSPACTSSSTSTRMELLEVEDTGGVEEPRDDGRVRPAPGAGAASCAPTSSRWRSPSPRASPSRSTATCCAGRSGRCGSASTTARDWSCTPSATTTRAGAPGGPPAVVRRDGGPLPRPELRPLPPHGVRHRRVGPGLHDHVAGARLRLPGRDRLPRRRAARHRAASPTRSPTRSASTRRTTRVLWKHVDDAGRRRGPAHAPAGGLLPRHRRQLRVPRLLALLPGRQHRVRGARDRDHGHHALRRGASSRPTARSSTSAPTPRSTSTSSSPASTSTSTASANTVVRHASPSRCRSGPTTRTASRSCSAARRCAPKPRASRTTTGRPSGRGRWSTPNVTNGSARRSATSSSPAALPADDGPGARRSSGAPR